MGSRWPVDSAPLQKSIRNLDFEEAGSTAALFAKLIAQLPPVVTLFVVVDAVGLYEDGSRRREMTELVGKLLKLVESKAEPVDAGGYYSRLQPVQVQGGAGARDAPGLFGTEWVQGAGLAYCGEKDC